MSFWKTNKPKKPAAPPLDTGQAIPVRKKIHRSPPIAFEAKILAIEAIDSGADRHDVAEVLGVKPNTISNWTKAYHEKGLRGLLCKPSGKTVRKQCTELEKHIVAHRTDNPEHGVRRISDELRMRECGTSGSVRDRGGDSFGLPDCFFAFWLTAEGSFLVPKCESCRTR